MGLQNCKYLEGGGDGLQDAVVLQLKQQKVQENSRKTAKSIPRLITI